MLNKVTAFNGKYRISNAKDICSARLAKIRMAKCNAKRQLHAIAPRDYAIIRTNLAEELKMHEWATAIIQDFFRSLI